MSFQIFLLVEHLTNWTGHNLLTDNTLKKRTQDVLVTCSVIVSDHNVKLAGHFQNLVGQCPMTDCYFQLWCIYVSKTFTASTKTMSTVVACVAGRIVRTVGKQRATKSRREMGRDTPPHSLCSFATR